MRVGFEDKRRKTPVLSLLNAILHRRPKTDKSPDPRSGEDPKTCRRRREIKSLRKNLAPVFEVKPIDFTAIPWQR